MTAEARAEEARRPMPLLPEEADVVEGARAIGFTLGMPGVGNVGVVEDIHVLAPAPDDARLRFFDSHSKPPVRFTYIGQLSSNSTHGPRN